MDPLLMMNTAIELANFPEGCRLLVSLSFRKGFTNPHEWCNEEHIHFRGGDRPMHAKEVSYILKSLNKTTPGILEFKKGQGFIWVFEDPPVRPTYQGQKLVDLLKSRKCMHQSCGFWSSGKCSQAS